MKQHLLTAGAILLVAASSFAQSRTASPIKRPVGAQDPAVSGSVQQGAPSIRQNRNNGVNKTTAITLTDIGSTSGNAYGGFVENKHTFAYDPNLNLLVFAHRSGGVAGGASKEISFDTSTDGGATWLPQNIIANASTTDLCRYPQACIWNPAGNTDIANAKIVSTGPCTGGAGWLSTYLVSANANAASTNSGYTFTPSIPNVSPAALDFSSWSMCNLNGGMGYVSARMDIAAQASSYHTIDFWKIVPDGNGSFTRSIKFTSAPVACPSADTASFGYDMAFGPDGNTGYIAHTTADLEGQRDNQYSHSSVLYKTTDAGETWTKQAGIDLTSIQMIIDSTTDTRQGPGIVRPVMSDVRLIVDNMNKCHVFAEISSGSTTCQDSTGFSWSGATSRYLVHLIVDGTNVQSNFIYRTNNTAATFGALTNAFNEQYQAGRSADGTHIFFSTCQTPGSAPNTAPNLFLYAYRTTDGKFMPLRDYTANTDADGSALFTRMSPVAMTTGAGAHKVPFTLMIPGADPTTGSISDTQPVTFFFLDGVTTAPGDYTGTMGAAAYGTYTPSVNGTGPNICDGANADPCIDVISSPDGVEALNNLAGKVSFMPNPTSGNLNINLTQLTSVATITVTDVTGRTINTIANQTGIAQLDLSAQAAGLYFVTVQNAEGRITAKIAVAK